MFQVSLEDMISADIGCVLFKRESKGYARVNNKVGCPSHWFAYYNSKGNE